jgi:hypothetical protein
LLKKLGLKLGLFNHQIKTECYGDIAAIEILTTNDASKLKHLFSTIGNDFDKRYFYSLAMARRFPQSLLEQWCMDEPESADARLVLGARLLKIAWDARGYGRGNSVSGDKWKDFYYLLEHCEAILTQASKLNPQDPTPWALLVLVATYHSYPTEIKEQYFSEALSRQADNWHAHMNMLNAYSQKYGGSSDLMNEFVQNVRSQIEEDSLLHCLELKVFSETWKYHHMFEENKIAAYSLQKNKTVINLCLQAYDQSLKNVTTVDASNIFQRVNAAGAFWILQQKDPLKRELSLLGNKINDDHWVWTGCSGDLSAAKKFAK